MKKILTKKEAMTLDSYIEGKDGEYKYKDKDGLWHISRDGKDVIELRLLQPIDPYWDEKLKRHIER